MKKIFTISIFSLLFLVAFFPNTTSAQSITTIDLPDYGTPKVYDSNDTIAVCYTNANRLYYRFKHDTTWVQTALGYFDNVSSISVYNSNIYVVAYSNTDTTHSGILVSADLGLTWTQKITPTFYQMHFQNGLNLTSSDTHFAIHDIAIFGGTSVIKTCNYSTQVIDTTIIDNPYQLYMVDSTLYYSSSENQAVVIGGGFMSSTNFSTLTLDNNPPNLQNPFCYRKGNQQLLVERATGKFITSTDSGLTYHYYSYTNNIPDNGNLGWFNIICGYGHFYVLKDTLIYHSSDGANWTSFSFPQNFFTGGLPLEILPNGNLVSTFGDIAAEGGLGLYTYNLNTNLFEDFMIGMREMKDEKLSVNNSGNMNFVYGLSVYSKVNSQTFSRKFTSGSFNSHFSSSYISDNGAQFLYNTFQTNISPYNNLRTTDNWQTYQTLPTTGYSLVKNDSILNIDSGYVKLSTNAGNSFNILSGSNPFNNPQCYDPNYFYIENNTLLAGSYLSSNINSSYPVPTDYSLTTPICLPYSQDFGNTWTYTTHVDNYGIWWSNFPTYSVYPSLYGGNIYAICSFFGYRDSIYKYNFINNNYESINHLDTAGVYDNLFHINGTFYVAQLVGQALDIYKTADINTTPFNLVVSYPLQNSDIYGSPLSVIVKNNKAYFTGFYDRIIVFQDTTITTTSPQTVTGKVFLDANNNNTFDVGEEPLQTHILHNNNGNNTVSNYFGNFYYSPLNANDTLRVTTPNYYVSNPAYHIVNAGDSTAKFALHATSNVKDLEVTTTHYSVYRPGFQNNTQINYRNKGTVTQNAVLKYLPDSLITIVSHNPTPTSISGDTLIWNIANLLPQQTGYVNIVEAIAATTPLGLNVLTSATIFPTQNDSMLLDNYFNTSDIVVGSYDPNDKAVEPASNLTPWQLAETDKFTYTIRFQNTGTYAAFTVNIVDTISNFLDLSSIEIIATSHNCNLKLLNNNIVKFEFLNINLPDSNSNEPTSHGFVKYRIKPKHNLPLGTNIKNTAYIYFDFNEAIITNTTQTQVVTSIVKIDAKKYSNNIVFPNPAKQFFNLNIVNNLVKSVAVKDVTGSIVLLFTKPQTTYNISNLSAGIYFVEVCAIDGKVINKLVVE